MRIANKIGWTAAAVLVAALAHRAEARPRSGHSVAASINIDAGFEYADDLQRELLNIGIRAGISPGKTVLFVGGFDLSVGLAQPTGFSYESALYPLGIGVVLGPLGRLTILGGVGVGGVTDTLAVAGRLPLEIRLDLRMGTRVRLELSAAVAEVFGRPFRENGAPNALFADELALQANFRIGKTYPRSRFRSSNGYYLGFVYREYAEIKMMGIALGHSLDMAR